MTDSVNHPSHYNQGSIETIDFIECTTSRFPAPVRYHIGNAIKYLSRAPFKNGKEDLEKARWYLNRALAVWELNQTPKYNISEYPLTVLSPDLYITETSKGYKDPISAFTIASILTMCVHDSRDTKEILTDCLRDTTNLIKRAK